MELVTGCEVVDWKVWLHITILYPAESWRWFHKYTEILLTRESRVTVNCHARFEAGENLEIASKSYLSLKVSTLQFACRGGTHRCLW